MKTTSIVGFAVATIVIFIGVQLPTSGNAGYVVVTGTTTDREAAKQYFQNSRQFTKM